VLPCSCASWSSVSEEDLLLLALLRSQVTETISAAPPKTNKKKKISKYMLEVSLIRPSSDFSLFFGPGGLFWAGGWPGGVEDVLVPPGTII
jgi:hypothetical protein